MEYQPDHSALNTTRSELKGLILAGGYSRRMGTDKSLLSYHGRPQREHLFVLLNKFCSEVFISCRRDQNVPASLNPVYDYFQLAGPLNGILSAFRHKQAAWLTVAVDMPFVDELALERLVAGRDKTKMATCYYNRETRQPEPLLTLWESIAYNPLLTFAENGNISPREFLKTHPVKMIDPPDERTLMNFNSPADDPNQPPV